MGWDLAYRIIPLSLSVSFSSFTHPTVLICFLFLFLLNAYCCLMNCYTPFGDIMSFFNTYNNIIFIYLYYIIFISFSYHLFYCHVTPLSTNMDEVILSYRCVYLLWYGRPRDSPYYITLVILISSIQFHCIITNSSFSCHLLTLSIYFVNFGVSQFIKKDLACFF